MTKEMLEKENDWQATGTSFKYKTKIIEIVSYFYPTWEKIIRILELRNQANKEGKEKQFTYALVCILLDHKTFKESGNKLKLKKENKDLKEENSKLKEENEALRESKEVSENDEPEPDEQQENDDASRAISGTSESECHVIYYL